MPISVPHHYTNDAREELLPYTRLIWSQIRGRPREEGGGALSYQMDTNCYIAAWSGSGERQHLGAVSSFWGRKSGGGGAINF